MANTPNYNLAIYPSTDITTKFITFRTDIAGTQESSNFMIIDSALNDLQTDITNLQNTPGLIQVVATGTNTYVSTISNFTEIEGQSIILSVNNANTGASTLNINSLGATPLMKYNTTGNLVDLESGDLRTNCLYLFTSQSTNWVLVGYANADNININGTVGNIVGINSTNTISDTGISQDDIELKINSDYQAAETINQNEIVGLGSNNQWYTVQPSNTFPVGTLYGVANATVQAGAALEVIVGGICSPSWSDYTTTTLTNNSKIFIQGEVSNGIFTPTDNATTSPEGNYSYLTVGYYINSSNTKLDVEHSIITLNVDGNISEIDGIALGGASGASGTVQVFEIGNGTDTTFELNHGANTTLVQLWVRTTATPQTYIVPDWEIVDNNNISITFDTAPTTNEYQALIFIFNPTTKTTMYQETIGDGSTTTFYIEHNLGVNYPSVKVIQLSNDALVFPSVVYADSTGTLSENVLTLNFANAPASNSFLVLVESDVVQTEGAQLLGGHPASYYQPAPTYTSDSTSQSWKFADGRYVLNANFSISNLTYAVSSTNAFASATVTSYIEPYLTDFIGNPVVTANIFGGGYGVWLTTAYSGTGTTRYWAFTRPPAGGEVETTDVALHVEGRWK